MQSQIFQLNVTLFSSAAFAFYHTELTYPTPGSMEDYPTNQDDIISPIGPDQEDVMSVKSFKEGEERVRVLSFFHDPFA